MAKFEVRIVGDVPDCLLVEAKDEAEACDKAIDALMAILEFEAAPAEEAGSAEPEKAKCGKARRSDGGNKRTNKG